MSFIGAKDDVSVTCEDSVLRMTVSVTCEDSILRSIRDFQKIRNKIINRKDGNYNDNNSEINIRMVSCSEV